MTDMKFYSDKTKQFYDTEAACQEAETKYDQKLEEATRLKKEKEAAISKEKKELALAIEQANAKLEEAYQKYDLAKEEADRIIAQAKEEAKAVLIPAKENITAAQKEKCKAISDFNDKYGAYTVSYSGDKAYSEFLRSVKLFDNIFNGFFNF